MTKSIGISEHRSGVLWNDTWESGRNWNDSAELRKNRRNTHEVFKYMTSCYKRE